MIGTDYARPGAICASGELEAKAGKAVLGHVKDLIMSEILEFIVSYMAFLWAKAQYQIVGSKVTMHNGGDARLLVESVNVRLRFICDRGQLFLDFQSLNSRAPKEWYSVDLIRRLIFGNQETSSFLDESYAAFLREHMEEIERRFSDENWEETHSALRALRARRAKEIFGRS